MQADHPVGNRMDKEIIQRPCAPAFLSVLANNMEPITFAHGGAEFRMMPISLE